MTNPSVTLEGVSFVLPDGRVLFSGLTETFDSRHTGLVGRNGVGKTVLTRIIAGELAPCSGRCARTGRVHYLPQQAGDRPAGSVAGLAGVEHALAALARIEAGGVDPGDFQLLGERWGLRQQLQAELARAGLGRLSPDMPAAQLSGGEAMRVALIGALLSGADLLVLDEPSNHLDRDSRAALAGQLQRWQRGLLVISHDRQLLGGMERIVELSPQGLRSHGGNYDVYAQDKAGEQQHALRLLEQRKAQRRREQTALRQQRERLDRRQASGNRRGREANQAAILTGNRKSRSEVSAGKLLRQQEATREQLDAQVREAVQRLAQEDEVFLQVTGTDLASSQCIASLRDVDLPHVAAPLRRIDLELHAGQRIGVTGPNGAGKSTLLRVLAGSLAPAAGLREAHVATTLLDQRLTGLEAPASVLDQLRRVNSKTADAGLRTRLAQLGLDAQTVNVPAGTLSGGERLKAALACAVYADSPVQLLLLDEPGNHLDLPSVAALEAALRSYPGTLVVVSHDEVFLSKLELTHRLCALPEGWRLERAPG